MEANGVQEKLKAYRAQLSGERTNGLLWLEYADFLDDEFDEPERTVSAYEKAAELLPDHDLRLSLGPAYVAAGITEKGLSLLKSVTVEKPSVHAFCLQAHAYLMADMPNEAEHACRQAIEIEGDFEEAFFLLGQATRHRSRKQAIDSFRKAIALNPQYYAACLALGRELIGIGAVNEGVQFLKKAIEIEPDDAWARTYYATACWKQGRIEEADEQYEKAIETSPEIAEYHKAYAHFLAAQGRQSEAESQWAAYEELSSSSE
jgi:tetratricopeptide (TPR) repeat protein